MRNVAMPILAIRQTQVSTDETEDVVCRRVRAVETACLPGSVGAGQTRITLAETGPQSRQSLHATLEEFKPGLEVSPPDARSGAQPGAPPGSTAGITCRLHQAVTRLSPPWGLSLEPLDSRRIDWAGMKP